jgi:signal peptidase
MAKRRKMGKRVQKARETMKKRRERRAALFSIGKDILIAVIIVIFVMGALYAYSGGIWPPMVVVESESMMHGDDSQIGVIDTGDLTIVKKISSRNEVVTYVEGNPSYTVEWRKDLRDGTFEQNSSKFGGKKSPLSKYGDYGEVIIYKKNGEEGTPVIHRAILWIEPNTTPDCLNSLPHGYVAGGNFPDIRNAEHPDGLECVTQVTLKKVGYKKDDIQIDVKVIMENSNALTGEPFAGFLTKGDHNRNTAGPSFVDQQTHRDNRGQRLAPIKVGWVVGKAKGELPWFGSLKLVLSNTREAGDIPPSSWRGLIITIVLIIVIPFIIDMIMSFFSKKKKKEDKEAEKDIEEEDDKKQKKKRGRGRGKSKKRGKKAKDDEDLDDEEEEDLDDEEDDDELFDEFEDDFEDMAESRSKKKGKKKRRR